MHARAAFSAGSRMAVIPSDLICLIRQCRREWKMVMPMPAVSWSLGLSWSPGLLVSWSLGLLVCWSVGPSAGQDTVQRNIVQFVQPPRPFKGPQSYPDSVGERVWPIRGFEFIICCGWKLNLAKSSDVKLFPNPV
jgi:hypothetical protein